VSDVCHTCAAAIALVTTSTLCIACDAPTCPACLRAEHDGDDVVLTCRACDEYEAATDAYEEATMHLEIAIENLHACEAELALYRREAALALDLAARRAHASATMARRHALIRALLEARARVKSERERVAARLGAIRALDAAAADA